jgi:hypothetical protein
MRYCCSNLTSLRDYTLGVSYFKRKIVPGYTMKAYGNLSYSCTHSLSRYWIKVSYQPQVLAALPQGKIFLGALPVEP